MNVQGFDRDMVEWVLIDRKPYLLALTETHVTSVFEDFEIGFPEYNLVRVNTHSRHTGGLLIYIRNNLKYKIIKMLATAELWTVDIDVFNCYLNVKLITVYRSPNSSNADFIKYLFKMGDYLNDIKNVIILGDFNINWNLTSSFYTKKLKQWVGEMGYKQIVNKDTRITSVSSSMIDLVITNIPNLKCHVSDSPLIGDHNALTLPLSFGVTRELKYSDKERIDWCIFQTMLENYNWDFASDNIDILTQELYNGIEYCKNNSIKKYQITHSHSLKAWFTGEVKELIMEKKIKFERYQLIRSYSAWGEYKLVRNRLVSAIRKAKKDWYESKIDNVKNDPTKMWKTLKSVVSNSKNNNKKIDKLEINGVIYSDDYIMKVNKLNEYYIQSINDIVNGIPVSNSYIPDFSISNKSIINAFEPINLDRLTSVLCSFKNKRSSDSLDYDIIKPAWDHVGHIIHKIINISLQKGIVPELWKTATITPVPKMLNSFKASDMRPINVLPFLEKVLEEVVLNQLKLFINSNDYLVPEQSGFREKHSTETAIQLVVSDWIDNLDDGSEMIGVVFLDFKRAFETIDRELLVRKLEALGIKGSVIDWIRSYLIYRRQKVKMNDALSVSIEVPYGVPQGSKIGPLLFLLYINDIVEVVKDCKIRLFADDTLIYVVSSTADEVCRTLNSELGYICDWLSANRLMLNESKSKVMYLGCKRDTVVRDIYANGCVLERVREYKYLGVILDDRMTFNAHAEFITGKIAKKLNYLSRIKNDFSLATRATIYNTIILPHFNYCATIMGMFTGEQVSKLQKLQNRAMRILLNANRYENLNRMRVKLDWLSVNEYIKFNMLIFIFRLDKGLLPKYFNCYNVRRLDKHKYNIRSKDCLCINMCKKSKTSAGVFYRGVQLYNGLPKRLKNVNGINEFKKLAKQYICELRP